MMREVVRKESAKYTKTGNKYFLSLEKYFKVFYPIGVRRINEEDITIFIGSGVRFQHIQLCAAS